MLTFLISPFVRHSLPCQIRYFSSVKTCPHLKYIQKLKELKDEVIYDTSRPDMISVVAMNRAANKNALSASFVEKLHAVFDNIMQDSQSRVVVIGSLIPRVFCAGADLKERAKVPNKDVPALVGGLRSLFQKLHNARLPIIAALDGAALGGGLEMALGCDMRYASTASPVILGLVETHWALIPGAGGTQRLPRLVGASTAKELMFRAKRMNAKEALGYGVVNGIVSADECAVPEHAAFVHSLKVAEEIAQQGPLAVRMVKHAVHTGLLASNMEDALEVEGNCYEMIVPTADRQEGMKAFAEKRNPVYKGE